MARVPDESMDLHVVVCALMMRILNRDLKRSGTISSEENVEGSSQIADIACELKDGKVYFEIQKDMNKNWIQKILKRDEKTNTVTIVIDLNVVEKKFGDSIKKLSTLLKEFSIKE